MEFDGRDRVLDKTEEARLLASLPAHLVDVWKFGMATGLRVSNVTGMRWSYLDLDNNRMTIPAGEMKCRSRHKTKRGKPFVRAIGKAGIEILRRHYKQDPEFVFTYKSKRLHQMATETIRTACAKAELDPDKGKVTFHTLRHTYITRKLLANVPVTVVAALVDDDPTMILRVYSHIIEDDLAAYADVEPEESKQQPIVSEVS